MTVKTFSPGKIIITGEHSVVYGEPALVAAIDLGVTVEVKKGKTIDSFFQHQYPQHLLFLFKKKFNKNLDNLAFKIDFNIPIKSGLGSSAACAHAIFLALLKYFNIQLSKEDLFALVLEGEKFMHGNPSGVDPMAVVYGGLIRFQKNIKPTGSTKQFKYDFIKNKMNFNQAFLINSGQAEETTKEMVCLVADRLQKQPNFKKIITKIGQLSQTIIENLEKSEPPEVNKVSCEARQGTLGHQLNLSLIQENERLLEELGVVGTKAKKMIKQIEKIGGVAKITGAGGVKDGSGLLLVFHPNMKYFEQLVKKNNWEIFKVKMLIRC